MMRLQLALRLFDNKIDVFKENELVGAYKYLRETRNDYKVSRI